MDYPTFNKISAGEGDPGLALFPTSQENLWDLGVRFEGGQEVKFVRIEIGEHDYGQVTRILLPSVAHERIAVTSDPPPDLPPGHITIS